MNQEMGVRIQQLTDARKTAESRQRKLDKLRSDHIQPLVLHASAVSRLDINLPPERALKSIIGSDAPESIRDAATSLLAMHKELATAAREAWNIVRPLEKEIEDAVEKLGNEFASAALDRRQAIIDRFVPLLVPVCNNDRKEAEQVASQLPRVVNLEYRAHSQWSHYIIPDPAARLQLVLRLRGELEDSEAADLGLTTTKKSK